jgi:hypothetical protein
MNGGSYIRKSQDGCESSEWLFRIVSAVFCGSRSVGRNLRRFGARTRLVRDSDQPGAAVSRCCNLDIQASLQLQNQSLRWKEYERRLRVQGVWKREQNRNKRCEALIPAGAFNWRAVNPTATNRCKALRSGKRVLGGVLDLLGTHAPASRIARIVFLNPRILSTRMRL